MRFKLFEEYDLERGGFISVPSDFEDRLKAMKDDAERRSKVYSVPLNQIKIDLFYGIKYEIRMFLEHVDVYQEDRTQEEYEKYLNSEIFDTTINKTGSGILKKFSGGKYYNIEPEDVQEVKSILWKYINEYIPYDEVDYYYTYDLQGKLMNLLDEFLTEIQEKGLWKDSDKEPYSESE